MFPFFSEFNGFSEDNSVNWNNPATYSNKINKEKVENKGNVSNINLNPKVCLNYIWMFHIFLFFNILQVNGGGEVSPQNSSHGQGSPLRSNLALKLKSSLQVLQCPMCNYTSQSPNELEEHVNR